MAIQNIITIAFTVNQLLQMIMHYYPPLWQFIQQRALSSWPNSLPTPEQLVEMSHKNLFNDMDYFDLMSKYGLNNEFAGLLKEASNNYLSAMDYITLFRRGELDETQLKNRLNVLHYPDKVIPEMLKAAEYFPNPSDLVRFAVREVYTPEIVEKYGLKEDLPQEFLTEAAKAGLPKEQAENYWAAHWELPSMTQGYEMFHRRVISEEDLETLMRAKDIMPNWRKGLKEISYNPLTRVDVRRMYDLGVLDTTGVFNSYLDVGYSPENAKLMTEFTIKYTSDEMKGLTRSNVISSYKKGYITKEKLIEYLKGFGYSDSVVQFWSDTAEFEKEEEFLTDYIKDLLEQYEKGMLSENEVIEDLRGRNVPENIINEVRVKLSLVRSKRVKLPTKSELENWLKLQVIDEDMFKSRMEVLGYSQVDTLLFLSEIAKEVDTSEVKFLPPTVYVRWLSKDYINEAEFTNIMRRQKVSEQDIANYIREAKEKKG